jgi:uncharacterized protein YbaR (Trm112 family)
MVQCPTCGHSLDDDEALTELEVGDELECRRCRRAWMVAGLEPLRLESSEQELAFTD